MSSFKIRPRFERTILATPEQFKTLFENALANPEAPCLGRFRYDNLTLYIPEAEQHYWSPQLSLQMEEEDDGTLISGIYGPRPSVWALFFYGYAIVSLVALALAMWGSALWMLKKDPWPFWGLPILGAAAVVLYLVAQSGQKLGAEQMFTLHHFFEETIGKKTHIN